MPNMAAKLPDGMPYLCEDTRDDGWYLAVIYASQRQTEFPYVAHILNPEEVEVCTFRVQRDIKSTRLSFECVNGAATPEQEAWVQRITEQYDTVLEGLGE